MPATCTCWLPQGPMESSKVNNNPNMNMETDKNRHISTVVEQRLHNTAWKAQEEWREYLGMFNLQEPNVGTIAPRPASYDPHPHSLKQASKRRPHLVDLSFLVSKSRSFHNLIDCNFYVKRLQCGACCLVFRTLSSSFASFLQIQ